MAEINRILDELEDAREVKLNILNTTSNDYLDFRSQFYDYLEENLDNLYT